MEGGAIVPEGRLGYACLYPTCTFAKEKIVHNQIFGSYFDVG
jgi:hypothetical protein